MGMDFLSPDERRLRMQAVKSKNSKAELIVFRYLRRNKIYFQKHYSRASGSPDVALPRKKKAIFIDGDFWHGRSIAKVMERGIDDYWTKKIQANMARDIKQMQLLGEDGWTVLRVWESNLLRKRTQLSELKKIHEFLTGGHVPG